MKNGCVGRPFPDWPVLGRSTRARGAFDAQRIGREAASGAFPLGWRIRRIPWNYESRFKAGPGTSSTAHSSTYSTRSWSGSPKGFVLRIALSAILSPLCWGHGAPSGDTPREKSERFRRGDSRDTGFAVRIGADLDRRSMKYKRKIAADMMNAAATNMAFAVSTGANARTPSPRNPAIRIAIEATEEQYKNVLAFLFFISGPSRPGFSALNA